MSKQVKTDKGNKTINKAKSTVKTDQAFQDIDAIFKTRWHGAVNIRGIRYQILYSVFRAFDLYKMENLSTAIHLGHL